MDVTLRTHLWPRICLCRSETKFDLDSINGGDVTLVGAAIGVDHIVMAADGQATFVTDSAPAEGHASGYVVRRIKVHTNAARTLGWAGAGPDAISQDFDEWMETDDSTSWNEFARKASEKLSLLNGAVRERFVTASAGPQNIFQMRPELVPTLSVLVAGYFDDEPGILLINEFAQYDLFGTESPQFLGPYVSTAHVACEVARGFNPTLDISDPDAFKLFFSLVVDKVVGLHLPIDVEILRP